jgi:hypothetical protein
MTRPTLEVADVVRQYGAAYLARYGATMSPEQHRALRAIAVCRTAALGGHATQCEQCGHLEITYNSCGNRHCPKCPGRAQAAWLAAREAELLDVPYVHVVFTLPHTLSPLVLQNPRRMYSLLCYVNLQGKKKTLPLSGTSNRLTHFRCVLNSALGRPVNDRKLLG